jgi:transposase
VTPPPDLSTLSHAEKDALIASLFARLAAARDRIAALETRVAELTRPPKTPGNSSKPPSQGQKTDRPEPAGDRPPRERRPGMGRTLHPNPDRVAKRTDAA